MQITSKPVFAVVVAVGIVRQSQSDGGSAKRAQWRSWNENSDDNGEKEENENWKHVLYDYTFGKCDANEKENWIEGERRKEAIQSGGVVLVRFVTTAVRELKEYWWWWRPIWRRYFLLPFSFHNRFLVGCSSPFLRRRFFFLYPIFSFHTTSRNTKSSFCRWEITFSF